MSVSQRIQLFETRSSPNLQQASLRSSAIGASDTAGAAAEPATSTPAASSEKAAGGGGGTLVKSSSSYAPPQKPMAVQSGKEFPRSQSEMRGGLRPEGKEFQRSQSEMRGGPRPEGKAQSARLWRPAAGTADAAEPGRNGMSASASAGRFPALHSGGAALTHGQGGSLRVPAANSSSSKHAEQPRQLGTEAFERLGAAGTTLSGPSR